MLTFLRKIRKSLIVSGTTRRYMLYAIGEITLVVIGILIALQINNWNEWRKDRVIEKRILIELKGNLERNAEMLEDVINLLNTVHKSSPIIIQFIEDDLPYSDTLDFHFRASISRGVQQVFVTQEAYKAYLNVGIDIIQSDSLKNRILNLFEVVYTKQQETQNYLKEFYYQEQEYWDRNFIYDGGTKFKPKDVHSLKNDSYYYSLLNTINGHRKWMLNINQQTLEETNKVLQFIKDELQSADSR